MGVGNGVSGGSFGGDSSSVARSTAAAAASEGSCRLIATSVRSPIDGSASVRGVEGLARQRSANSALQPQGREEDDLIMFLDSEHLLQQ